MTEWIRESFEISNTDGGRETVSGWTRDGVGLHEVPGGPNRQRWHVTHLRSGLMFLFINDLEIEEAAKVADLIVAEAHWAAYDSLRDLMRTDPEWVPRLLGIKHALGIGNWIEFPDPAMNDPANMLLMPRSANQR